jgi:hypothetical protein
MASISNTGPIHWMNSLFLAAEKDQTADIIRLFSEIRSGACKIEEAALIAAISKATIAANRRGHGAAALILTHFNPLKENYEPTEEKSLPNDDTPITRLHRAIGYSNTNTVKTILDETVISTATRVEAVGKVISSPFPEPEILKALLATGPISKQDQTLFLERVQKNSTMSAMLREATTF